MGTTVSLANVSYTIPATGDGNYGDDVSAYLIALANNTKVFQVSSANFPLQQETSFGSSYGLKVAYIKSQATNPAGTGILRLGNTEAISWRNAGNSADLSLSVNASNKLIYNTNELLDVSMSAMTGLITDAQISASAAIAYSKLTLTGSIVNADVSASAAIALSKLAALTSSKALVSDASGIVSASSVTATELSYLSGVTSSVQTQLNSNVTALSDHAADTSTHGVSGAVVGTTDTQDLSNKSYAGSTATLTGNITTSGGKLGVGNTLLPSTVNLRSTYNNTDLTSATSAIRSDGTHTLTANNAIVFQGVTSQPTLNQASFNATVSVNSGGSINGYHTLVSNSGASGTTTAASGYFSDVRNTGAGVLTNAVSFNAIGASNSGGGTLTNHIAFLANASTAATNVYGFKSEIAAATGRWNVYADGTANNYFAGSVGIGVTTPNANAILDVTSTTKAFMPPRMTTAQKNAIGTPTAGMQVYDSTLNTMEVYNGSAWVSATPPAFPTVQILTGSGTYTPTAGTKYIEVEMVGGGGGGGGSGTTNGTAATAGGDTTFGTRTAGGGGAGGRLVSGAGGTVSGTGYTIIRSLGGAKGGESGVNPTTANGTQLAGGSGGSSFFGGAGNSGGAGSGGGTATAYGSGGGGGGNDNVNAEQSGGGGGAGAYLNFMISAPSAVSYGVGAAGSAGGAGTSGRAGGAGFVGTIIVKEYY